MINPISHPYVKPNRAEGGNCPNGEESVMHGAVVRGKQIFTNEKSKAAATMGDSFYCRSRSDGGNSVPTDHAEEHGGGHMEGDSKRPPTSIEDSHRSDGAGNTSDDPTKLRVPNFRKGKE